MKALFLLLRCSPYSSFRRILLSGFFLWSFLGLSIGVHPVYGGSLSTVTPMGASSLVTIYITGTGFNTTASSNEVTFTHASGGAATATATAVTTLDTATGLRRLTVKVPAGLPVGTTALRVLNKATGEASTGKSLEVIEISLPDVTSASLGASNVNVRITGSPNTAFVAGSTRATFGAGVTVNTTTVESPTSLVANITVSPTAAIGIRGVAVITNTQTAQRAGAFSVVDTPVNHPPTWSPLNNPTLNEGTALDFQLAASDPDGDSLVLTVSPLPVFARFSDLGNGMGTLSLTPNYAQSGSYSLTATATDSKGATASLVLEVTVTDVNRPPTAGSQQLTVAEDTALPLTLSGIDPDGDPLTFSIVVPPAHGSLSGSAPALTYTPAPDYYGTDAFQFTANDAVSSSELATVAITVTEVNDPPVLGANIVTGQRDQALDIVAASLLANDAPGPANESTQTLAVTGIAGGPDTHGTVALVDGTITYTPAPGFIGPATFTYTACDNGTTNGSLDPRCSDTGMVTVNVAAGNGPPALPPGSSSCQPSNALVAKVSGPDVIAYIPKGSWLGSWGSGWKNIGVVNVEGSSITPQQIITPNSVNSCATNFLTGQTVCTANNTDVYVITGTTIDAILTSDGSGQLNFSGGICTNCGVAMDPVHNKAVIELSLGGTGGYQYLNLGPSPTFEPAFASKAPGSPNISEDILIDPVRNLILSPSEEDNYELVDVSTNSPAFYENPVLGDLDSAGEDCSTGIALATIEFSGPSELFIADLTQATFIPGSPAGTWSAPSQVQSLSESFLASGSTGLAVAQGTHTGIVTGEFGGDALTAIALPTTSGSGIPAINDWVTCRIPGGFAMGRDPHTVTAYQSPNGGDAIGLVSNIYADMLAVINLTRMLDPTIVPRTPEGHACASEVLPEEVVNLITVPGTTSPLPFLRADFVTIAPGDSVLIDVLTNDDAGTGAMDLASLAVFPQPPHGTATVEGGQIRYSSDPGRIGFEIFTFGYTVCDGGACGGASIAITIGTNQPPTGTNDTYDVDAGATLTVTAPGVLANDSDPDVDVLQARLVRGVTNGQLLLNSNGGFTYTPNDTGIDTFVYHVLDSQGAVSGDITVTIFVTGPPGPPIAGNDFYEIQQGRELVVDAPGVLANDTSPNPRLSLTLQLVRDVAKGTLLLHPDGSFVYTPEPGFTGFDQFSYLVRDAEGRLSEIANVGITVTADGPPTPVLGATSPPAGSTITEPTHFSATLVPPAGETITRWTVSYRRPGDANPTLLSAGSGPAVDADFDPTTVRNGTYAIIIRAESSGGGVLVSETGLTVDGNYKPGRYTTTFSDFDVNAAHLPIELLRTYDSADKVDSGLGVGWSLELSQFRVDTNGALGSGGWSAFTCGGFPFLATCYASSVPHYVTVTWPDGRLERFRFAPNQGALLFPTITTAAFIAEPGTTSTLEAVDYGLVFNGSDFLLGDFFFTDGIYNPVQFVLTDRSGTTYTLDRRVGLLSVVDRNGNSVTLDDAGIQSSSGPTVTFNRDGKHITQIVTPTGTINYTYSAAGDLTGVLYPNGTTQAFTYDAQHDLLTISGGGQVVRTLHYDASGRLTAVTDGNGNTSTISINVAGRQEVVTDPTGALTTVNTYDNRGNLIQQDRVAGGKTITTSATYDGFDRELSRTDGLGHTTSQTYDTAGNVLTQTNANGHTTTYTYNAFGQPLTITDPLGHVTTNTYDAKGNLTETVAPDGGRTTYTYDASGNPLTTTDPTGRITTRTYDAAGQLATVTDSGGNTTHQTVDASGRVTSVTDPTGAKRIFGYDAVGRLTGITDANGHTRTAGYNAFDRVTSLTDPTGATVHQVYDATGNLISVTDRNGQTITYTYDAHSRLLSKTVPGAGVTTFTYDAFGRLTGAVNDVAQLAFSYDDADHVLTANSAPTVPNAQPTSTFTYTYDAAGTITSAQAPGGTTSYSYDANSHFATITDPMGGAFDFGYDPTGRQTSMTRPNGISDSTSYSAAGDLISLHSTLGATLVNQGDYTYNPANLRSSFTSLLGTATYTYDGASRLTSATPPAGSGLPNERYTYDPVGNRISSATSPLGSFSYDSGNRLLGDATTTYTYDQEGNLVTRTDKVSGATTTYTWTAEHQLVGIAYPDNTTSTLRYDPLGRRVEITHGSAVTRYAYDQRAIAAEYDSTNTLAAHWIQAGPVNPCPLEMVRDGQRYFYLVDGRHSTTALTNMSGATVASYRYQAFGTPLRIGTLENPFEYRCTYIYGIAGLGFPSSGPYDPASGQFLNDNPIEFPTPNPFRGSNPITPPGDDGSGGRSGGGNLGGGGAEQPGGSQCAVGPGPKIYPEGWKVLWLPRKVQKLAKVAKKLIEKAELPRGGTEYGALLPTQEMVQAVADYGFIVRCQIAAAANALGP